MGKVYQKNGVSKETSIIASVWNKLAEQVMNQCQIHTHSHSKLTGTNEIVFNCMDSTSDINNSANVEKPWCNKLGPDIRYLKYSHKNGILTDK